MSTQIEMFDIENPCIGVCQSNKRGYCLGCLRRREERQLWFKMTNEERREVLRLIGRRQKRIEKIMRLKK